MEKDRAGKEYRSKLMSQQKNLFFFQDNEDKLQNDKKENSRLLTCMLI